MKALTKPLVKALANPLAKALSKSPDLFQQISGGASLAKAQVKPLMKALVKSLMKTLVKAPTKALCNTCTHILVFFPTDMGGCFTSKGPSEAPNGVPSLGPHEGPLPHTYTLMHISVFFFQQLEGCFTTKALVKPL